MHIAFLTSEYPHSEISRSAGIGSFIKNSATALVAQGKKVSVFVYAQPKDQVLNDSGITVHSIASKKYALGGFFLYRTYIARYINRVASTTKIDLLEAPEWTGITAFMRLKVPVVLRLHGSDTYFCHLENRPQKKKNFFFEKTALKSANHIVSVSSFTAKKTKELFGLKTNITIIPNFISTALFIPVTRNSTALGILNFGSIIRKKGVISLAKAFNKVRSEIPNATLHYLGTDVRDIQTGKMTSELIIDILDKDTREQVTFLKPVPYKEVQPIINEAAVIALPSYAEAFPMTWLEAMALEKPLVTSNIGWAHEMMVDGVTGYCVHPDNTDALSDALINQLRDTTKAQKMGANARQHIIDHFDEEMIVLRNIEFYKAILTE